MNPSRKLSTGTGQVHLPTGPPPFLPWDYDVPPVNEVVREAFDAAGDKRVFVVGLENFFLTKGGDLTAIFTGARTDGRDSVVTWIPDDTRTLSMERFPGLRALKLFVVQHDPTKPPGPG